MHPLVYANAHANLCDSSGSNCYQRLAPHLSTMCTVEQAMSKKLPSDVMQLIKTFVIDDDIETQSDRDRQDAQDARNYALLDEEYAELEAAQTPEPAECDPEVGLCYCGRCNFSVWRH